MQKIPTGELNKMLENTTPNKLDEYFRKNNKYMAEDGKAYYYYMKDVLNEKNIRLKDVYISAGVSESYGSKIISMEKHTKNRDLIIRFCIAGHFNWDETSMD